MTPGRRERGRRIPALLAATLGGLSLAIAMATGCTSETRSAPPAVTGRGPATTAQQAAFLDTLSHRTFNWFWDLSDHRTGMTPDRWPTKSFVSVAASGFALTAYPIGAERGWVTRGQAARRVLNTVRFFWTARQDTAEAGCTGHRGFFYHFLEPETGHRFRDVELSTVDTALLLAGMLFCQTYFDRPDAVEDSIRALADSIYRRVDWRWAQVRPPMISHGWNPRQGYLPYDWGGYNESMILIVLALGSPTHAVAPDAWAAWTRGYRWGTFQGQEHVGFAPLFGHQYSHVWLDLRGIQDEFMRQKDIDYFENSRRATLAQRAYAIANPQGFAGYGEHAWGLSACDGPLNQVVTIAGRERRFETYSARGASFTEVKDDGTLAPTAAGGSIAFAPEVAVPALMEMARANGDRLFGRYGFLDAFNPTLRLPIPTQHGAVDTTKGWFDTDYLGIDQGPILAMAENHRSGLVWRTMRRNPYIVRGLERAGFSGGWLDSVSTR